MFVKKWSETSKKSCLRDLLEIACRQAADIYRTLVVFYLVLCLLQRWYFSFCKSGSRLREGRWLIQGDTVSKWPDLSLCSFSCARIPQPQHCWHFRSDTSLLWGCPARCGMFSGSPGLCRWDADCKPPPTPQPRVGTIMDVSRHCQKSPGGQSHPWLRTAESRYPGFLWHKNMVSFWKHTLNILLNQCSEFIVLRAVNVKNPGKISSQAE